MADSRQQKATAELLKAFSHPTRLSILQELLAGPRCVTDMEEILPARQANISQHLAVLRHARLVDYAQDGVLKCYYLCRPKLVKDLLTLMGRDEPMVIRTAKEIKAEKKRLADMSESSRSIEISAAVTSGVKRRSRVR
ncbi:MAG: winged helix-turn-helix transcriptional regulator [Planctomyces sp.]|nr:winged helix-turn-helix transcriptional regulator [Planctomyces sp.]